MQIIRTQNNIIAQQAIDLSLTANADFVMSKQRNGTSANWRQAEDRGQFTNHDLNNIMAANGIGTWKFDMHTQQINLCQQANRLLGFKEGASINLYQVIRRLVKLNAFGLLKALKSACKSHNRIDEVLKTNNGIEQWLKITGTIFNAGTLKMMGTITDITEFKNEEQRQKDLMAFLSHELRTPLSTMKLYIQNAHRVASMEKNGPLVDRLMKADCQTINMANMIDNFLTLSHTEASRLIVNPIGFNLTKLVDDITANMALMHPDRVFKIKLSKPVMVQADREKIAQVINNYITNAIKYSPEEGAITITCKQVGNKIKVTVSDEGKGISLADQKNLFQRFCRVHDQNEIRAKGFGLGLFLSREIIEAHDGKVWVKSQPDKGSMFGFTLPAGV